MWKSDSAGCGVLQLSCNKTQEPERSSISNPPAMSRNIFH